jgi:hypothetical protein
MKQDNSHYKANNKGKADNRPGAGMEQEKGYSWIYEGGRGGKKSERHLGTIPPH